MLWAITYSNPWNIFDFLQAHEIENYIHDVGVFGLEDDGPLNMQVSLLISDFIENIYLYLLFW